MEEFIGNKNSHRGESEILSLKSEHWEFIVETSSELVIIYLSWRAKLHKHIY